MREYQATQAQRRSERRSEQCTANFSLSRCTSAAGLEGRETRILVAYRSTFLIMVPKLCRIRKGFRELPFPWCGFPLTLRSRQDTLACLPIARSAQLVEHLSVSTLSKGVELQCCDEAAEWSLSHVVRSPPINDNPQDCHNNVSLKFYL